MRLRRAALLDAANYPTWTLARQAWGSARLGLEALQQFVPEARQHYLMVWHTTPVPACSPDVPHALRSFMLQ